MKQFESSIPALFYGGHLALGGDVVLSEEEARHARALRLQTGGRVLLLDGRGTRATGKIASIEKRGVTVSIGSIDFDGGEGRPYIALAIGVLSDKSRLEWCVEKGVELGVREIILLQSERSEGFLHRQRLERVAIAALKQSQRSILPRISEPIPFPQALERIVSFDRACLCHETAPSEDSLARFLLNTSLPARCYCLSVRKEGFPSSKSSRPVRPGARLFRWGVPRLRSETAALVAMVLATQQ